MEKVSKSFRLPTDSIGHLKELASYLKESETDVLVRAIDRLYAERDVVFQQDVDRRKKERGA